MVLNAIKNILLFKQVLLAVIVLAVTVLLIWGVFVLFRRATKSLVSYGENKFKAIKIKNYQLFDQKQVIQGILFSVNSLSYVFAALILLLALPLIFGIFPETRDFAFTLLGYFLSSLGLIFFGIINYIPKLITIFLILFVMRYVLQMLKFFSKEIERGRLVIKGFYPDWAKPTFSILKYLLYAFTIALIYPYLPSSDTKVFQGISLFVGVLFSLGSSSAIGNLVAGLVITYMRPFQIGDRIQIGDNVGMVVEKTAVVVRIQTDKKEYVTFPNVTVLTSSITNFSQSKEFGDGLLIHSEVTYGYGVEWRKVHELLISAAKKTPQIEQTPEPFVLQKSLDNLYCTYEINAYTKDITGVVRVYSELHKNIQDAFTAAGLDLTTPNYGVYELKK